MSEEYLTRNYVAVLMQVDVRTVDKWIKNKILKAIKISNLVRILKSSFDALPNNLYNKS